MSKQSRRRQRAKMVLARSASDDCLLLLSGTIAIEAAAEGGEKKGPRRFTMVAYNGGELVLANYPLPVVVDLDGLTVRNKQTPIYYGHHTGEDGSKLVGHSSQLSKVDGKLVIAGVVSAATQCAKEVVEAADNGYEWQTSIGALPYRQNMQEVPAGKNVTVNGRQFTGPIIVARKAELRHVAVLPEGADRNTSVSIAASAASKKKEISMEFSKWIEALGFNPETLTAAQTDALKKKFDAEIKAAAAAGKIIEGSAAPAIEKPKFDLSACVLAHQKYVANIEAKAASYKGKIEDGKLAEIQAKAAQKAAELKAEALNGEKPAEWLEISLIKAQADAEVELIRAERPKGPAIHGSTIDATPAIIEAAACQSLGLPEIEKRFDDQTLQAAHTAFRGRLGLQQLIIMAAAANGYMFSPGERAHVGNLRDILSYAMPRGLPIHAAGTLSLPGILSNIANKELLQGFMEEDQTWREISATKTVSDFKAVTSYRLLDNMEYEELPPGGTMRHGTVSEESYTRQAKTYAKMFSLDRTDIVNDDLGAFDDLRTRLGRGAARKFNDVFWAKFLNNSSFFTSARGNYISGATTNLGTDFVGLAAAIEAFDDLRSTAVPPAKKGKRIGGVPAILLVPPELEAIALQIFTPVAAATTANVNVYAGKYRPVKVHQLSDSTYTGYSSAAWYLLRNPAILAAMVVSFLNGVQTPAVESADADFDQLGIQFRGYHDFGCDQAEWLAGVKSKGAA